MLQFEGFVTDVALKRCNITVLRHVPLIIHAVGEEFVTFLTVILQLLRFARMCAERMCSDAANCFENFPTVFTTF